MAAEEYTFAGYLGVDFQQKFMWQLVTEPEFAEKILPTLEIEYFDDAIYKRFFVVLNQYYKTYGKVANLQNKSIELAIKKFSKSTDPTEFELLSAVADNIMNWNERVLNKEVPFNGDVIQKEAFTFIKQQEYRKLADYIQSSVKRGEKSEDILTPIEDRIKKIVEIGVDDDMGIEIMENIGRALKKEFRKPIPTGIATLDLLMKGGLGNGEIGIILAPSGVGKSTILSKIANTAYNNGKNVLQIIFEDTEDQIRRKHYAIWSETPLSVMDDNLDDVEAKCEEWHLNNVHGRLIVKRFSQESTTMPKIRQYIDRYQKKFGIIFDTIILDYLDCVETHKQSPDQNASELAIIKAFESMAVELDVPCWTALQTNRSGFGAELVTAGQMGGNIKRAQKTHLLLSVAKTPEQQECGQANIAVLKARMVADGQIFKDCIFNNDTMEIRILDQFIPKSYKIKLEKSKIREDELDEFNSRYNNSATSETETYKVEQDNEIEHPNDISVNSTKSVVSEPVLVLSESESESNKNILKTLNSNVELDDNEKDNINNLLAKAASNQRVMKGL